MSAKRTTRRGTILVASVVMLGVLALATLSAVDAGADDARLNALRFDSLRAFYAAESAVEAAIDRRQRDPSNPLTGTISFPSGAEGVVIDPLDESSAPYTLIVEGRAGEARRRIEVTAR
ncbi:MAG: hypothetical protein ACF8QF_03135 [Phycisphaerales bacterium]